MTVCNTLVCPNCGGELKHYDSVKRVVKGRRGVKKQVKLRRLKCSECSKLHRELPESILPYKHYESEVIKGVREGLITPETIGFEDYPCSMTMFRWTTQL
jgi:hypothetical protein